MLGASKTFEQPIGTDDKPRYFAEARSWSDDQISRTQRSEKRAWIFAVTGWGFALLAIGALALMVPLKQTVPYVLSVDRTTGNVEVLDVAEPRSVQYQPLLDKHWAQRYVIARESYHWRLLQQDYELVLAMSSDDVAREYTQIYEGPNARDKKLGAYHELRVKVLSVTAQPDVEGRMVVRFERQFRRTDVGQTEPPQTYVATMAFEYHTAAVAIEKQLLQNPLGFRVVAYRLDAETSNTKAAD